MIVFFHETNLGKGAAIQTAIQHITGDVKAWGILQNRSGKVTRQFSAVLNGKWDGKQLVLDEKFNWSDGEIQTRQWQITKIDEHILTEK